MAVKQVTPAEIDGRNRCVDMLFALQAWWEGLDLGDVKDDDIGEATLQQEPRILRQYLDEMRRAGPEAERGFMSKLSEFVAGAVAGWPKEIIRNNYDPRPE